MLFKNSAFFPPIQALLYASDRSEVCSFDYSFLRYFLNDLPNTLLQTVENGNYLYISFMNEFVHWQYLELIPDYLATNLILNYYILLFCSGL